MNEFTNVLCVSARSAIDDQSIKGSVVCAPDGEVVRVGGSILPDAASQYGGGQTARTDLDRGIGRSLLLGIRNFCFSITFWYFAVGHDNQHDPTFIDSILCRDILSDCEYDFAA